MFHLDESTQTLTGLCLGAAIESRTISIQLGNGLVLRKAEQIKKTLRDRFRPNRSLACSEPILGQQIPE